MRCAVRRLHARPHAVRRPLLHGPDRFAVLALRRRDHRQRLRGAEHGHHDAHGAAGARAHRASTARSCAGLHSTGELDPDRRFIMHFPEELSIKSFGSGYGGNALLGKKCHALRIASWQARTEGLARRAHADRGPGEPGGRNALHRLRVPFGLRQDQPRDADSAGVACPGWKVWTVGDDIAWLHPGAGRPPVGHQSRGRLFRRRARAPTRRPTATPTR